MHEPLRITLELEPGADPIVGRLYAHDHAKHCFYGWLEFAAAIEAACEPERAEPTERNTPGVELDAGQTLG